MEIESGQGLQTDIQTGDQILCVYYSMWCVKLQLFAVQWQLFHFYTLLLEPTANDSIKLWGVNCLSLDSFQVHRSEATQRHRGIFI